MSLSFSLCLLSFALCYVAARQSLASGLITTLAIGYAFGITKANLPETASYFIFDSAVLGLYAAQLFRPLTRAMRLRIEGVQLWMEILIFWCLVVFFFPAQDLMIRLVGLRASIFFLPFLLIGARLSPEERYKFAIGLAALNLVALAFAGAEFVLGVQRFFPRNVVTKIIFLSNDVADRSAYRIPACFANAHAYAGAMVVTIPFLAGALLQKRKQHGHVYIFAVGLIAAILGVLLSATRLNFVVVAVLMAVLTFSIKSRISYSFGWLVIVGAIALFASGQARLQRLAELQNTEMITERVGWSINMNFVELASQYPFGNGLGGGGSNIPYFLQDRLRDPVVMESEYARIMLEQGIFGLLLWVAFIIWLAAHFRGDSSDPWQYGRRLAWWACVMSFGMALLGIGLFVTVPATCLLFINAGWVGARQQNSVRQEDPATAFAPNNARQAAT